MWQFVCWHRGARVDWLTPRVYRPVYRWVPESVVEGLR